MPEIVSRDRWGSVSKWKYGNMKLPARNVFLHHTVTTPTDFPYQDAKQIEKIGISQFGQMSYSYLVHPNGTILEGAGTKTGAHTANQNSTSFGIALIGDYDDAPGPDVALTPSREQIESVRWLIHHLKHEVNQLLDGAVLTPHRAVKATACPGNKTMALLEEFRTPWVPPTPSPITAGPIMEVDVNIQSIVLSVPTDGAGNGWIKLPYAIESIVGVLPHSGTRPGADGFYDAVPNHVSVTPEDTGTVLVVRGGDANSSVPIWLKVIV